MKDLTIILEIEKSLKQLKILNQWDKWEIKTEKTLTSKLLKLFKGPFERIIIKLKKLGFIPSSDIKLISLLSEFDKIKKEYITLIEEIALEAYEMGRNRASMFIEMDGAAKKERKIISTSITQYSENILRQITGGVFIASENTMKRIKGNVQQVLMDSYTQGLGIEDTAKKLQFTFTQMKEYELKRIARTEILSYQNMGVFNTCNDLDIQYKQWLTSKDSRVRLSHVRISEQITNTQGYFDNKLRYPGDKTGPIEEWIECRCKLRPYLMPFDYMAPLNREAFFEWELISISEIKIEEKPKIFQPVESIAEARIWMENNLPGAIVSYEKITNINMINKVNETIFNLSQKYKDEVTNLTFLRTRIRDGNYGWMNSGWYRKAKTNSINVNLAFINSEKELISKIKNSTSHFFTKVDEENIGKQLVTHEFGHVYFSFTKDTANWGSKEYQEFSTTIHKIKEDYWKFGKKEGIDFGGEYAINDLIDSPYALREMGKDFVSMYAMSPSEHEWFAECFTNVELNSNPSKYAVRTMEAARKFYEEK